MNRIDQTFVELKAAGRKGLVGYLTAGDPTLEQSEANIREALTAGLDVLELGVPFSDPTADGPTIQAAAKRALESGTTLAGVLAMVTRLRADFETPIVLFGYANPFLAYGYERLCADASAAGADGFLVVDLPYEEAPELKQFADAAELHFIPLVAPTTPPERMAEILSTAGGFVYYIMVTGVTGARVAMADDVADRVALVRAATDLPIAVGFGVSDGTQAAQVGAGADAVVVGSALVKAATQGELGPLVEELASALHG